MKLKSFVLNYNKYFIYFNTFYDHLFYNQNTLQTPTSIAEITRRLYSVHAVRPQRTHGALEDPTACYSVSYIVLSNTLHAQHKRRRMAIAQRFLSVSTALMAFATRRSASFVNAVGTL